MNLLQLLSAVLFCLLLELLESPSKALQLYLLDPQLSFPTPISVTEESGYQALPQTSPPASHPSLSLGSLAHLDSQSFCGVLGLLKLALQLQQRPCFLL